MRILYVVNASPLLKDAEIEEAIEPLQTQIDRDFIPAWENRLYETEIRVRFARKEYIPNLEPDAWPIFLNRHSTDPSALGWHNFKGERTFSRVFVGDCLLLGLNWQPILSHEALELILNPNIKRVYRIIKGPYAGRFAAFESCDAVESDSQAYDIGGFKASNFVLQSYFSANKPGPWDFMKKLSGGCPELTEGGYLPITSANGSWTQISKDQNNGLPSRRAAMVGQRRMMIQEITSDAVVVEPEI